MLQAFIYQRFIVPASETVRFGKALNRSVTGSMNQLITFAKHWLVEDELSRHDVGFKLNDILLAALARGKSDFYWKPREAFEALVASSADSSHPTDEQVGLFDLEKKWYQRVRDPPQRKPF